MKYFLDFGTHLFSLNHPLNVGRAHNGLLSFVKRGTIGKSHHVVTYEASPRIYDANLVDLPLVANHFASFEAVHAAVTDYDGLILFNDLASNPSGSNAVGATFTDAASAMPERRILDSVVQVPARDIRKIIAEILVRHPGARFEIKMDIEGSEFRALGCLVWCPKLLRQIDVIYVEFHERFWRQAPWKYVMRLLQRAVITSFLRCWRVRVEKHW